MKDVDTGNEKVKKICDLLRRETLAPAQKEANSLLSEAKAEAERIVRKAQEDVERIRNEAQKEQEREFAVFTTSLHQACKKTLASLREAIEKRFFHEGIAHLVQEPMQTPSVIAALLTSIVQAIEKEGIDTEIEAVIPKTVQVAEVLRCLSEHILQSVQKERISVGSIGGGVTVTLCKDNLTIDITDQTLTALLGAYLQKPFREMLFQASPL